VDFFGVCVLYSVRDVILVIQRGWTLSTSAGFRYRERQLRASDLRYGSDVAAYCGWKSVDNYDTCASVFVVQFNGFMSLTSYFDVMYRY
jgi:hypothetical protein